MDTKSVGHYASEHFKAGSETVMPETPRVVILFLNGRLNRIVADYEPHVDIMIADEPRGAMFNTGSVEFTQAQVDPALVTRLYAQARDAGVVIPPHA